MYNIGIILTFKECMGENRFEFKQGKISPLEYLNLKHHKYTRKKKKLSSAMSKLGRRDNMFNLF